MSKTNASVKMSSEQLQRAVRVIVMYDGPLLASASGAGNVETCKRVMDTLSMNFSGFDRKEAERVIFDELMGA